MTKQWWNDMPDDGYEYENISLLLDSMYPELSKKERDILCVYRVLETYGIMLEKEFDAESYLKMVDGYEEKITNWIIKLMIVVKPQKKYQHDLEKIIRWVLFREKEEPILEYYKKRGITNYIERIFGIIIL